MDGIHFSNTIKTNLKKCHTTSDVINNIFGDGLPLPCLFMVYGNPGSGKTTLLCQMCNHIQYNGISSLAIIGEMRPQLSASLCNRLGINIPLTDNMDFNFIKETFKRYKFVIIDSLPLIKINNKQILNSNKNIQICIDALYEEAYNNECCVGVIVHSTKNGSYRGGSYLPHMVDTQIQVLNDGDNYKTIKTIKNRYGKTGDYIVGYYDGFIL